MNKRTLWITRTAILLALLVAVQVATAPFGNTFITGSLVNLILIVSVMIGGLGCGLTVALLSPIFAFLLSIGPPFWQIIVFIAIGNALLVLVWYFMAGRQTDVSHFSALLATVVAAIFKFGFLYLAVVQFVIPILLQLPAPKATVIGAAFSYPQLVTALIGGVMATLILPTLRKAIKIH